MKLEKKVVKYNWSWKATSEVKKVNEILIVHISPFWSFNPYPLHFGNIQERHLWKKNYFSVLGDVTHDRYFMTSYASITTPVALTIGHIK